MERNIVSRIIKQINALDNAKAIKIHGSHFMELGTPDIFAVIIGVPVLIETKQPGKKPSNIQDKRLREWREAGALIYVKDVTIIEDILADVERVLDGGTVGTPE